MSALVVIIVVAGLIAHAWLRVALLPNAATMDATQAHRELLIRLRYAILITLFFAGLYVLGVVIVDAGIAPGGELGLI